MKLKLLTRFSVQCAILSLVLCSSVATAQPTFVFPLWDENDTRVENELTFIDNDLILSVTAWTASYNSSGEQLQSWQQVTQDGLGVYQDDNGLGVISSDGDGNDLDGGSSSNYASDPDEGLLFSFNRNINIFDFFVGDLDSSDDFNISNVNFIGGNSISLSNSIIDVYGPDFETEWVFETQEQFGGTSFMLWVDGRSDDIEVLGVSAIPEPKTLLLFSLSLLALIYSNKRLSLRNKRSA